MKFICPLIVVEEISRSRHLYETILGQKVKFDYGQNIVFEGDFSIHLRSHFQELIDPASIQQGGNNFELYFEEDDLDPLQDQLIAEGFEFVHQIREQPWRQQVVRFYDHDKHIIEVGERLEYTAFRLAREGLTINEISSITYLPEESVQKAIEQYSASE